jgi:preprotein translocase subunit SecF
MTRSIRTVLTTIVVLLGVGLMVGGIITRKNGAVVVGLIVAAVATQQWIAMKRQRG